MTVLRCRPADAAPTEIRIGHGLLAELDALAAARSPRPPFLLVDGAVGHRLPAAVRERWHVHTLTGGEAVKTLATAERVLRAMVQRGLDRSDLLVAVGGGATGDLGGLCAGLFLRGVECWQVPTTLLAMVDSAVGGKTAVNLPEGKNLVGMVHAPRLVLADLDWLGDLPEAAFQSGLAEVLKAAIGLDAGLFALLEAERDRVLARQADALHAVVTRAVAAKIAVVEADLRETGPRRLLNLGHTLGHALEAHGDHRQPHGLCVARGLHFALDVAAARGRIAAADAARCRTLLEAYGYRPTPLPDRHELRPFLARDKKLEGGRLHFVVPTAVGSCEIEPIAVDELLAGAGWSRG